VKLRVRVVRYGCSGHEHWYADIDDADDRQPDDPYWYLDRCASQCDALYAACTKLAELEKLLAAGHRLTRVSGRLADAA
jgi:hypothetical protein